MVAILESTSFKSIKGIHIVQTKFRVITTSEATFREPVFVAPFPLELKEVTIVNSTIVVGADTNQVNLNLIDGGLEGAGTTQFANIDLVNGTDLIVGKTQLFDGTTRALERFLALGTMLELEAEEVGTGDATDMPELLLIFAFLAAERAS